MNEIPIKIAYYHTPHICFHEMCPVFASLIAPNVKSSVYCHAIAEGGPTEWAFGWNQFLKSKVASEKEKLLNGLGCSKEVAILTR